MIKLIKPYTRIRLAFIAKSLNISVAETESLLVSSILDGFVSVSQAHRPWVHDFPPGCLMLRLTKSLRYLSSARRLAAELPNMMPFVS